jgi:hypothetical protein
LLNMVRVFKHVGHRVGSKMVILYWGGNVHFDIIGPASAGRQVRSEFGIV